MTFSVEEGLLFLSNPLCMSIIQSCLVAAYLLYPVRISHITVEATHIHMVITVLDPDHVNAFIRHFKTESAHAINTILGRKKEPSGVMGTIVLEFLPCLRRCQSSRISTAIQLRIISFHP